jgi:putative transport protein
VEPDLKEILSANWTLLLFVVIAIGDMLSKIRLGGVPLGSTAGMLIAGIVFGHLGFPNIEGAANFGFRLFVFSVGMEAGQRFFSVFPEDGARYIVLAIVVAFTGVSLALRAARIVDLRKGSLRRPTSSQRCLEWAVCQRRNRWGRVKPADDGRSRSPC